jgi:biotin transport system substrate-specific component
MDVLLSSLSSSSSSPLLVWFVVCCLVEQILTNFAGSLLISAGAQIAFYFPWDNTVPFTFQTWAVLLVGATLGWLRGGLAALLYFLLGLAGAPFFAGPSSGIAAIKGSVLICRLLVTALLTLPVKVQPLAIL